MDAWVAENPGKPMKECPTSVPSEELGHAVECATPAMSFADQVVGVRIVRLVRLLVVRVGWLGGSIGAGGTCGG